MSILSRRAAPNVTDVNRLDARFARLAAQGRKALVIYATSGDPSPRDSAAVFAAAAAGGADVVEIGIPFSDPTADGPAIQAASERALERGGGFGSACRDAAAVRRAHPDAGVILFGYANPYLQAHGRADLGATLARHGADGALVVDVPPEEDDKIGFSLARAALRSIRLITPVSTDARLRRAAAAGGGFLYCVAVTGVTGGAGGDPAALTRLIARTRRFSRLPVVIGFGVRGPRDAAPLAAIADGVVIGSAVVRLVEEYGKRAPGKVEAFVRKVRRALDAG